MLDDRETLAAVSGEVVKQMRIKAATMKTYVAIIEHVTRRPQASMGLTSRELAEVTGISESGMRRHLQAVFGQHKPWSPCEDEGDLLEQPVVCPKCHFTTARSTSARKDLFGMRHSEGSRTRHFQSYCRWCKNIKHMPSLPIEQGLLAKTSLITQLLWTSRGMEFDGRGRPTHFSSPELELVDDAGDQQ